jgi:protein O-GlcNAc transferase
MRRMPKPPSPRRSPPAPPRAAAGGEAARRRAAAFALLRERRLAEAAEALRAVLAADAADAEAWNALGDALHSGGVLDDARRAYAAAVALDERQFAPWWGLGCVQARRGEHALAAQALERAVALRPQHAAAWHNLGKACHEIGRIEDAIDAMRRAAALEPEAPLPLRGIAVAIPADPRADAAAIRAARRAFARRALAAVPRAVLPVRGADAVARPLRIGYLGAFFRQPNWMKPVWALVNHHDRTRVAVHLLSEHPREQIDAGYDARPEDGFLCLAGLDAAQAAARIAALDLDVLVDLNGYSAPDRLAVVAARPARRVLGWFNHFATSGLDAYDAVVADDVVLPPGTEGEFDERIVRVPGCHLTFEVRHPAPEVAPPPVLGHGHLTFGCFAQLYKLNAGVVATFARILRACPGARLLLKAGALGSEEHRAHLRAQFASHGVAADALLFEGPQEHRAFLEAYGRIDITLETFPYGGATTATESLWQGVPVLAFAGHRWSSRLAATMLRHAGLHDWIAADADDFVERAIALFHDPATPQRLATLRASMRERLRASPACDAVGFARAMERVCTDLVARPAD